MAIVICLLVYLSLRKPILSTAIFRSVSRARQLSKRQPNRQHPVQAQFRVLLRQDLTSPSHQPTGMPLRQEANKASMKETTMTICLLIMTTRTISVPLNTSGLNLGRRLLGRLQEISPKRHVIFYFKLTPSSLN